jgi:hypothetical protein
MFKRVVEIARKKGGGGSKYQQELHQKNKAAKKDRVKAKKK